MKQRTYIHKNMNGIHIADAAPELLAHVDLNLLVAFDVLARERSVTRAAQRMGVTQSALSHALRRLRELFADPLLVRGEGGMMLTPRATNLVIPIRSGLSMLGRAVADPEPFEPSRTRRAFCVASPDVFDLLVLPGLLTRLRKVAPGVDLVIVPLNLRVLARQLEAGEVDLGIVPHVFKEPDKFAAHGLLQRTLLRDQSMCLVRRGHPALRARASRGRARPPSVSLSVEDFAALPHLLVSPAGGGPGPVDHALAEHGLRRRVGLRLPTFSSALAVLPQSDLVLTVPASLAEFGRANFSLVAVPVPVRLPTHHVNLTWHERFSQEPGLAWLREIMSEATRGIGTPRKRE
jgi:DNA-binding transcriptional LysR family regulator